MLLTIFTLSARGVPVNRRDAELDSAVDGVQKYLESSGFPKMTRGEVLEFLDDFSRNSRVSRSDNTAAAGEKQAIATDHVTTTTRTTTDLETTAAAVRREKQTAGPKFPEGESPLNYGYPMSALRGQSSAGSSSTTTTAPTTTTQMMFVTVQPAKQPVAVQAVGRSVQPSPLKKTVVGPSVDLNAYSKFKKIPEARNVKIDDEMTEFLSGFGLMDPKPARRPAEITAPAAAAKPAQRRNDDALQIVTETVDELLLKSLLAETGANGTRSPSPLDGVRQQTAATGRGHVFNPSDSDVKTVDVNRIAKIVENIRLLADGNDTASLSQDAIQKRLENITADIAAIDRPAATTVAAAGDKDFDGYQVFFDDESKEVESDDLPVTPNAAAAAEVASASAAAGGAAATLGDAPSPPDPLSTDELQQLVEKNKNDVKRQEPVAAVVPDEEPAMAAVTEEPVAASTSSEAVVTSADSSLSSTSEAAATSTVAVVTSAGARDASSTEASPSLSQLAESFGGGETASNPPPAVFDTEAPRDNRPRNGLYFYVDWNSFLTVNEGQKNQVNLRFAPKAGNPAHFLKVNVP